MIGFAALAAGAYLWSRITGPSGWLFEGGFFAFAVLVAAVIFCVVTAQAAPLSRALGNRVFRYLGKISYGTYLWHFPLFALFSAERVHLYGLPLLAVRIGVHPPRRHRFVLPGRAADPPGPGPFLHRVAGLAAHLGRLPRGGVGHRGDHFADGRGCGRHQPHPRSKWRRLHRSPVSVTLFGDSLAFTAGFALATPGVAGPYDVQFHAGGLLGCGSWWSSDQVVQGNPARPTRPVTRRHRLPSNGRRSGRGGSRPAGRTSCC